MSGFKFSPPSLAALPILPLGDPALADLVAAEVAYDGDPGLGKITFSFDASARGLIRVCNSPDDEDADDGVLGAAAGEETDEALQPTLVFDVPVGLPLYVDTVTGMIVHSSGWIGCCQPCAEIVASGNNVAHRLAVRFVDAHPETYRPPAPPENTRVAVREWKEKLHGVLLKKILNLAAPRPYVAFEDPLEGKLVDVTDEVERLEGPPRG